MKLTKFLLALAATAFLISPTVTQAAIDRDCDNNAVMYCGAETKAEFLQKIAAGDGHNHDADFRGVYRVRGVDVSMLNSVDTIDGIVTRDGKVVVKGVTVATDAISTGRQNIPGSTRDLDGFYERPTSVSFKVDQLDAWVYMPGGQFKWAIIKSCGNPVAAKAVLIGKGGGATPVPKPTPPAQTPKPAPTPAPVPAAPKVIPKTGGVGTGAPVLGLTAILVAAWYYRWSARQLALAFRRN